MLKIQDILGKGMLATEPGDILGDMGACDRAPLLAPRRGLGLQGCPNTFAVDE